MSVSRRTACAEDLMSSGPALKQSPVAVDMHGDDVIGGKPVTRPQRHRLSRRVVDRQQRVIRGFEQVEQGRRRAALVRQGTIRRFGDD